MTRHEYIKTVLEPKFKDQNELYHYGTPRRSGRYPYGSGKRPYQSAKEQHAEVTKMIDDLNTNYGYGTIIDGVIYDDVEHPLPQVDWSKYRTMPIEEFKKKKIGVCWDYVNYQHHCLDQMGVPNKNYMLVMPKSEDPDDVLTHTFTVAEIGDSKYWVESAAWPRRGVHKVNSYLDVVEQFRNSATFSKDFDVYEYDPTDMDKGLTSQEYFDKATENLVASDTTDKNKNKY